MSASKTATTGSWVVAGLAAFAFLASGVLKLSANPQMVQNFRGWGLSEGFLAFVGAIEVIGAIGLLVPPATTLAALGLALVMVGAIFTHLTHQQTAQATVPAVLLLMVTYLARERRHAVGKLWHRGGAAVVSHG